MWSLNVWQVFVIAVLLVVALGGSWSVVWWLRAFPTAAPLTLPEWRGRSGSVVSAPVTFAYSAMSAPSVLVDPSAYDFAPGARWVVDGRPNVFVVGA